jgi:hypothetical protein
LNDDCLVFGDTEFAADGVCDAAETSDGVLPLSLSVSLLALPVTVQAETCKLRPASLLDTPKPHSGCELVIMVPVFVDVMPVVETVSFSNPLAGVLALVGVLGEIVEGLLGICRTVEGRTEPAVTSQLSEASFILTSSTLHARDNVGCNSRRCDFKGSV